DGNCQEGDEFILRTWTAFFETKATSASDPDYCREGGDIISCSSIIKLGFFSITNLIIVIIILIVIYYFVLRKKKKQTKSEAKAVAFEESRSQIEQRVSVVEQGLARTGIRVVSLGTEEIIELFYRLFNPGELSKPIPLEK
ncbi:MAG: hypothetical protein IIA62_08665, partial [Nitrospinae bacterium]|nr:hypothetical protein [Nitrospinota bacterium]